MLIGSKQTTCKLRYALACNPMCVGDVTFEWKASSGVACRCGKDMSIFDATHLLTCLRTCPWHPHHAGRVEPTNISPHASRLQGVSTHTYTYYQPSATQPRAQPTRNVDVRSNASNISTMEAKGLWVTDRSWGEQSQISWTAFDNGNTSGSPGTSGLG